MERLIEGYYVETFEGLIFTVKGHLHPPQAVIAYLRYLPTPQGERQRGGIRYTRVYKFEEQFNALKERYPQYIFYDEVFNEVVQGVPYRNIAKVYSPREAVARMVKQREELNPLERDALELIELLRDRTNVPSSSLGISGSILVQLTTENSDIDFVVYGSKNCFRVHGVLQELLEKQEAELARLSVEELKRLYGEREAKVSLEKFIEQEGRKVIQAKFKDREFFVRFIKDPEEVEERYGDRRYKPMGRAEIVARVVDASDAIFTPCTYIVNEVRFLEGRSVEKLTEITSFRGRFCEQAYEGDLIAARGKLEMVTDRNGETHYRLLLGGDPNDYLLAVDD